MQSAALKITGAEKGRISSEVGLNVVLLFESIKLRLVSVRLSNRFNGNQKEINAQISKLSFNQTKPDYVFHYLFIP